ncbi:DNA sulfur modification protein DndB [Nocardia wallacei]|uniref:DNA sulfur modification protein DndB n=1 Tax=Nocardia wallacei TaxID=480035 RepID=UPI002453F44D|nr:DNA sulfur modification protein DndB [Nocardia wallacei]
MANPYQRQSIDPSKASAIPCLIVDENQVLATISLGHLMQLVPDPRTFEDKRLRPALMANPMVAELAERRETVQRYFTGAKKTNVPKYADFIFERVREQKHRGTPPICLGTPTKLTVVPSEDGTAKIGIPFGRLFLAVDGETQRAAWEDAHRKYAELVRSDPESEDALENVRIPVEIHHGLPVERLQALFYERNVLGAQVNANEAIAKDQRDPATQIVRALMAKPILQPNGQMVPVASIVQQASRQVGKRSPQWVTLSALRTLVVTTLLGRSGLQYGAKPVPLPEGSDFDSVLEEITDLVHAILQQFAEHFADKDTNLIGSPAIMAGIGVAANRAVTTVPNTSGYPSTSREELLEMLDEIHWARDGGYWDGIATRKTPRGITTVAGPKEVGYAVAEAIAGVNSLTSAKIRNKKSAAITPTQEPPPQLSMHR